MSLRFQGLCKSYKGKIVFENISGSVAGKEKIGLIGVNGIGKTTLARILAGEETCDQGEIKRAPSKQHNSVYRAVSGIRPKYFGI
ncbi:MAG: ATP-binding cassette domain-containing protein [Syntrophaceticus sp.]